MRFGKVKQFDPDSSYGFIRDDLNHKSYFVFYTAIQGHKRLEPGQRVSYELAQGKRGLQCVNVSLQANKG
jgi:CspA family cold shock protein